VKVLCRLLGHKLPGGKRSFIIPERYQRCERCGERVLVKSR
jgi:DNA-directed RNA polymerase subunit RPC12/RpoP